MIHTCTSASHISDDRANRISRVVPLDPPVEEDDPETVAEERCRIALAQDTSRGVRTMNQVKSMYASESRWTNIIEGIRGGKVSPAWERTRRRWFKRRD